jgi:hypothetical protein
MDDDPALRQFLESALADDAARSRAGVGALRERRAEDATLVGLLANLADHGDEVLIGTTTGHTRRGRLTTVGPGGAVVRTTTGACTAIRTASIAFVRSATGVRIDGDGRPSTTMSWPLLVATVVEAGDDVLITIAGTAVQGRLRSLSRAIAAIDTADRGVIYAVLEAADEVSVIGRS